jgi:hypothetical protein
MGDGSAVNLLARVLPTRGSDMASAGDGDGEELEELPLVAKNCIDTTNPPAPVDAMTKCFTNLLRHDSGLRPRKSMAK